MGQHQIRKRPVNLFVETGLLDEVRWLRINLSDTLEPRPRTVVKAGQEKRWQEQNRETPAAYNRRLASYGPLSNEAGLL
jgi:post-segregation antitoxin (ccd killing protein)